MCAVNDAIRKKYDVKIRHLKLELNEEENILDDIENAKIEIQQLVDEAQCAIDNLGNCDFGGDKILSSVITSRNGYQERKDYYDEYIMKCKLAIDNILVEMNEISLLRNSVPENCGYCYECDSAYKNRYFK